MREPRADQATDEERQRGDEHHEVRRTEHGSRCPAGRDALEQAGGDTEGDSGFNLTPIMKIEKVVQFVEYGCGDSY